MRSALLAVPDRLLDSGTIDPASLAVERTIASWTRDGAEHFARLR